MDLIAEPLLRGGRRSSLHGWILLSGLRRELRRIDAADKHGLLDEGIDDASRVRVRERLCGSRLRSKNQQLLCLGTRRVLGRPERGDSLHHGGHYRYWAEPEVHRRRDMDILSANHNGV